MSVPYTLKGHFLPHALSISHLQQEPKFSRPMINVCGMNKIGLCSHRVYILVEETDHNKFSAYTGTLFVISLMKGRN